MQSIIEYLRYKMIRIADERGSLTHPDVVTVSQQLDRFIVLTQQRQFTLGIYTKQDSASMLTFKNHHKPFASFNRISVHGKTSKIAFK